jgi:hypothetical protein
MSYLLTIFEHLFNHYVNCEEKEIAKHLESKIVYLFINTY